MKKYLPDAFILIGVYFISQNFFVTCSSWVSSGGTGQTCHGFDAVAGIVLLTLGIIIYIRKYVNKK